MTAGLGRRLLAEFTGTGLLVAVVVGSGIAATRLTDDAALRLLVNSTTTALGLAVLILVFTPAGGAQFNPVVTAADWLLARRSGHGYSTIIGRRRPTISSIPLMSSSSITICLGRRRLRISSRMRSASLRLGISGISMAVERVRKVAAFTSESMPD